MEKLKQIALEVRELTKTGEPITPEQYDKHADAIRAAFEALETETRDFVKAGAEELAAAGDRLDAARREADDLLLELATAANKEERETVDGINTIFWANSAVLHEEYSALYKKTETKEG